MKNNIYNIFSVIKAIKLIGFKDWFAFSKFNRILATEQDVQNWKTGN